MAKTPKCKSCGEEGHYAISCRKTLRKPIKKSQGTKKGSKSGSKSNAPTKRKKAETRSQLVKKLDAAYSQYIRLKSADQDGYCICVTSGDRIFWKEIQNGHFFSRKYLPTRWDDDNCHPQSVKDNVFLHGNYINYTRYMLDTYGRKFVDNLEKKAKSGEKITTPELREKLAFYLTEVKRLKEEKGL